MNSKTEYFVNYHGDFSSPLWHSYENDISFQNRILQLIQHIIETELELGFPYLPDIPRQNGYELNILFSDDAHIQQLNHHFRQKNQPTNVLSFPSLCLDETPIFPLEEPIFLGDMILAFETIEKEAIISNIPQKDHILRLIIHSIFHLLGYDHDKDDAYERMFQREKAILDYMQITNYIDKEKDII